MMEASQKAVYLPASLSNEKMIQQQNQQLPCYSSGDRVLALVVAVVVESSHSINLFSLG